VREELKMASSSAPPAVSAKKSAHWASMLERGLGSRRRTLEDSKISVELDEVQRLQNAIDRYGTPYEKMARAEFPVPKKKSSVVLYIGCVGMTTESETTELAIKLLNRLGVDFTLIDEFCCEAVKGDTGSSPSRERINRILRE
jgi:Fe-S oxidoreductase